MDERQLQALFARLDAMLQGVRQYIGARYVPRFTGEYDPTQSYEALDVVDNGSGTSYIAKIPTPAGTPLTDTNYWFLYGSSSGAIVNLQQQIDDMKDGDVPGSLQDQINDNTSDIADLANIATEFYVDDFKTDNNDYVDAFNDCLATMVRGGTVIFPKNCHFSTNKQFVINPFNLCSEAASPIIIDFNGARIGYTGSDWAIKVYSNGWNEEGSGGWLLDGYVTIKNIGALVGNSSAKGGIMFKNTLYCKCKDCHIDSFINGCGIQLKVAKYGDAMAWTEENLFENNKVANCLIGYQHFVDATGTYDGSDPSQSGAGTSGNHNMWRNCVFDNNSNTYVSDSNSVGFDIHGNMSRSVIDSCGGWLQNTNQHMFALDGWMDGVVMISPWVDAHISRDSCLLIRANYNKNISSHWVTIVGASYATFRLKHDDLIALFTVGYSTVSGMYNGRLTNAAGTGLVEETISLHPTYDGTVHIKGSFTQNLLSGVNTISINVLNKVGQFYSGIRHANVTMYLGNVNDTTLANAHPVVGIGEPVINANGYIETVFIKYCVDTAINNVTFYYDFELEPMDFTS